MIKRRILICIFSLLLFVSFVGSISATFTPLSVKNEFENGIVNIELGEKQPNDNTTNNMILPFSTINKKTYITNNGSDCYIRAKLTSSNEEIIKDATILGMSPEWIHTNDGYYYYIKVLKSNETVDVFEGIKLGDFDKTYQSSEFSIDVKVDAVQSKNFVTNFQSSNPWGDVDIVKVNNDNSNIKEYKPVSSESFKVIYQDDVRGMVKNFDSFFNNIGTLMPGDCYEDELEIKNNTKYYQEICFINQNVLNKEFLSKVAFNIIDEDGNAIYDGNLGEDMEIIIGTLDANASNKIKFRIEVPKEIGNEFALDTSSVTWVFSTKYNGLNAPQTGDNSHIEIYVLLMVVSAIGLFFSTKGLRRDEKDS